MFIVVRAQLRVNSRALLEYDLEEELNKEDQFDGIVSLNGLGKNISHRFCGLKSQNSNDINKIGGGQDSIPGAHPWIVSIIKFNTHWCGGSIINDRWVTIAI